MYKKCENCYKDGKVPNDESCKKCEDDLKAKEQECEELKKWKETVVELFERTCRCKYLNEENNHCSLYNRKCIGRLNQCLYKNQQALTEIKEIAEEYQKQYIVNNGVVLLCNQILQKISEGIPDEKV